MLHASAQNVYIPFGKYKNKSVANIYATDLAYLQWLAENAMVQSWKEIVTRALNGESIAEYANPPAHVPTTDNGVRTASLILSESGKIIVKFAYNKHDPADVLFKDELKRCVEGLTWEGTPHFRWVVGFASLPKLIEAFGGKKNVFASQDVKDRYREEIQRRITLDEVRQKKDSDIEVNTKIPLRNYQRVAIEFIETAGGRGLIADAPGVGKSATAIGYAVRHNLRTLIICPKSVVPNWAREIHRFAGQDTTIWTGKTQMGSLDNQFHTINYDIVEKNLSLILDQKFDLLVCDEATYIKSHKAKRTKAIMGNWRERSAYPGIHTPHLILLTGTPVLNKPIEAFQLLRFISKDRFNNILKFMEQYGGSGERPRNLDDLHQRTKDLMIRRKKHDVLTEMPSKQRDDLVVELPPAAFKEYNKVMDAIFRKWNALGKPSAAQMPAIQKFLLPYKLERAFEFIDEMIENGESVLVFSQYRQPILDIQKRYGTDCGIIMGGMDSTQRQRTIDGLRDRKIHVGAMTITSAGMGIDGIQYGVSTVLFLDRFWQPSVHEQAEDRVHRSGQTESVQVYYLTCKDTIDEDMGVLLAEKQEMIDRIVDGEVLETTRNRSFFGDFIKRIKARKYKDLQDAGDDDGLEEILEE